MFKKSAIAAAVAGVVSIPVAVEAADPPTVYGFVNIGIQSTDIDAAGGTGSIIFAGSPDGSIDAHDTANTRFGFRGSKDLGNGLSSSYRIEIGVGTTSGNRGGPVEDAAPWDKRLAQIGLHGNFGNLVIGNQWGVLYEYLGYNVYRSDGHGGAAWYESTRHVNDDRYGLRVSNAFTYSYGGGGYSADPFTFSVQAIMHPDDPAGAVQRANDDTIDSVAVGLAGTFGAVTINGVVYSESAPAGAPEVSLTGVGFRFNATEALYLGGTFMSVDHDSGIDDSSSWNVVANYSFGGGLSGMIGLGGGEDATAGAGAGDMDTVFLQLSKSLGEGVKVYAEFETASIEQAGGLGDLETSVFAVAVKNSF